MLLSQMDAGESGKAWGLASSLYNSKAGSGQGWQPGATVGGRFSSQTAPEVDIQKCWAGDTGDSRQSNRVE